MAIQFEEILNMLDSENKQRHNRNWQKVAQELSVLISDLLATNEKLKNLPAGPSGKSAYELWKELGNTGTLEQFIASLKGPKGDNGSKGDPGPQGIPGPEGKPGKDSASLIWKAPVNTFSEIATTYTAPSEGWTVFIRDTGQVYRRTGTTWLEIQDIEPAPYNALESSMITRIDQTDFVKQLSQLIGSYDEMYFKKENSLGWLTVMLKRGTEHVSITFRNNNFDEFWILGDVFWGDVTKSYVNYVDSNYGATTGTWVTSAANAHYATQAGATMSTMISGEKIEFRTYIDNRGGVWEFIIDDNLNDPIRISTYSATAKPAVAFTLKEGLENKEHKVFAKFLGDDPNNVPSTGVGTARGWAWYDSSASLKTFRSFKIMMTNNRKQDLLTPFSNKEFAVQIKKTGSTQTAQFAPMHNNIGTAFNRVAKRFIVDGVDYDTSTLVTNEFIKCRNVKMVQSVYGRNPDAPTENLAQFDTIVNINISGIIELATKMTALMNIDVPNGYLIMFPVTKSITTQAISSKGNKYQTIKTDGSSTYLSPVDYDSISYIFDSTENPDFAAAVRFNDIRNTLVANKPNKSSTFMKIEHRDANMQKLYPRIFENETMAIGETRTASASFVAGKVAGIFNTI